MLIIHFGVEGLPNRVVCDQLECTPQMLTDFNSCWTVDYKVNQFSGLTYAEVRITNHQELMDEVFNGFITCSSQLGLNIETCSELLDLNLNSSDTKYDDCKCFLPCISKILGTMNTDDGKWNEKRYWEIIAMIKVPEWKQEAEVIGNNCKDNVCGELLLKNKDHNDKKYDNCKCLGPCVAKKMGTMDSDTGKWNWARFKELSELMDNEMLRNESTIMQTHCMDEVNTHCTAGYVLMKCVLQNSPMAQDMVKNYLSTQEITPNKDEAAK
ncbi:hypothetical protein ACI65C_011488 [Semiaphis heraclei]